VTVFGETKRLMDWSYDPRCRVTWFTLRDRLQRGIPPEEAMTLSRNEVRYYRQQAQVALPQS
jgi:hypothetical protein